MAAKLAQGQGKWNSGIGTRAGAIVVRAAQKALALVCGVEDSVWIIEHSLKSGQNLRVIFNGGFGFLEVQSGG